MLTSQQIILNSRSNGYDSRMTHDLPFSAPGDNMPIWHVMPGCIQSLRRPTASAQR